MDILFTRIRVGISTLPLIGLSFLMKSGCRNGTFTALCGCHNTLAGDKSLALCLLLHLSLLRSTTIILVSPISAYIPFVVSAWLVLGWCRGRGGHVFSGTTQGQHLG